MYVAEKGLFLQNTVLGRELPIRDIPSVQRVVGEKRTLQNTEFACCTCRVEDESSRGAVQHSAGRTLFVRGLVF